MTIGRCVPTCWRPGSRGGSTDRITSLYSTGLTRLASRATSPSDWPVTSLVTARLREATGDLPGARRAIAREWVALPLSPAYH